MVAADPDFYRIGYLRNMRAYGVKFMEGPDGYGVYASKDIEPLKRARVRLILYHFKHHSQKSTVYWFS